MLNATLLAGILALTPGDAVEILLDDERTAVVAAEELALLRPFPVQELFWILQGDEIPAAWTKEGTFDHILSNKQRTTIELAFQDAPHGVCAQYLRGLAETEQSLETKATIVEILGWIGTVSDLSTLLLAASPESERYLAPSKLRSAFARALAEMHRRDAEALEPELPWVFRHAHSGLRMEVVKCVERQPIADPIDLLARMLSVHTNMDVFVLQTMQVVALRHGQRIGQSALQAVRPFLHDQDPACVRLACRTLGAMNDVESISYLIQLLDTDDENLRTAAAYGLSVGTGLQFDDNVLRWRSWFERERTWWDDLAAERFNQLATAPIDVALQALNDISARCLDREALAAGVAPALVRPEESVVLTACAYLRRLSAESCVAELVDLLHREEASIRAASHKALRSITGLRLGADPAEWEGVIRSIER
ncbi:MAG: HEAT repeat domain-containing protein [Planctomycetota bacterium]